ncbi:MAG: hypothetical protein ACK56I_23950, partial [bacterium]
MNPVLGLVDELIAIAQISGNQDQLYVGRVANIRFIINLTIFTRLSILPRPCGDRDALAITLMWRAERIDKNGMLRNPGPLSLNTFSTFLCWKTATLN